MGKTSCRTERHSSRILALRVWIHSACLLLSSASGSRCDFSTCMCTFAHVNICRYVCFAVRALITCARSASIRLRRSIHLFMHVHAHAQSARGYTSECLHTRSIKRRLSLLLIHIFPMCNYICRHVHQVVYISYTQHQVPFGDLCPHQLLPGIEILDPWKPLVIIKIRTLEPPTSVCCVSVCVCVRACVRV